MQIKLVYIALREYEHAGFSIIAVCSTEKEAWDAVDIDMAEYGCSCTVYEFEVGKIHGIQDDGRNCLRA